MRKLEEVAASVAPENLSSDSKTICFQIMYGLPWELQIRAACSMCERYLPVFEAKWPEVAWPRQLLGDVAGWHRVHGRATEDTPEKADSADTAYLFCFDFLLSAYHHRNDPASLTAGSCGAMGYAAYARARNVWLADDPVAARIEKEKSAYCRIDEESRPPEPPTFYLLGTPEHNAYENVAFITVYRREWRSIAERLRDEAVWQYRAPEDMHAMMRGLERWEAHEFYPMGPERTEPESGRDEQA